MPDGRFLSKSIAHSVQLGSVSLEADYLFARCIPHLDRDGRMAGTPELVKAIACPLRPEISAGLIPDLLRQLAGAGLVRWYSVDGREVLEFPGFRAHQKGMKPDREAASRFPASTCENAQDLLRTNSGPAQDLLGPSKVKLSQAKVSSDATHPAPGADGERADGGEGPGDENAWRNQAARLIKEQLWRSETPPPELHTGRPWTMARELSIWNDLIRYDAPRDVNGAIAVMRRAAAARGLPGADGPLSLRAFRANTPQMQGFYRECLAFARKEVEREASKPKSLRVA